MDKMMGRTRFLGRAAVLGAATFATLLAGGTVGVANAAQTATPADSIPCTLTVSNPTYYTGSGGSGVQATATIRCQYWTNVYLEIDLSYNGSNIAAQGQEFSGYVASETVTTSAAPGYYQASGIAVLGDGQQYGTYYSNNVYIPQ
jgi:hypothetical protein